MCDHARLVERSRDTYLRSLTIWNRRLKVLKMTIDLVATDFALAITTTSATSRAYVLRFAHDSNIFLSQLGRKARCNSSRIVRFLNRKIGCYLNNVRRPAIFATISGSGRLLRLVCGWRQVIARLVVRVITKDCGISTTSSIVGNRVINCSEHRPTV